MSNRLVVVGRQVEHIEVEVDIEDTFHDMAMAVCKRHRIPINETSSWKRGSKLNAYDVIKVDKPGEYGYIDDGLNLFWGRKGTAFEPDYVVSPVLPGQVEVLKSLNQVKKILNEMEQ